MIDAGAGRPLVTGVEGCDGGRNMGTGGFPPADPNDPDLVGVTAEKGAVAVGGSAENATAAADAAIGGAWSSMEETGSMGAGGARGGSAT
jgi:hypothetical protein